MLSEDHYQLVVKRANLGFHQGPCSKIMLTCELHHLDVGFSWTKEIRGNVKHACCTERKITLLQ